MPMTTAGAAEVGKRYRNTSGTEVAVLGPPEGADNMVPVRTARVPKNWVRKEYPLEEIPPDEDVAADVSALIHRPEPELRGQLAGLSIATLQRLANEDARMWVVHAVEKEIRARKGQPIAEPPPPLSQAIAEALATLPNGEDRDAALTRIAENRTGLPVNDASAMDGLPTPDVAPDLREYLRERGITSALDVYRVAGAVSAVELTDARRYTDRIPTKEIAGAALVWLKKRGAPVSRQGMLARRLRKLGGTVEEALAASDIRPPPMPDDPVAPVAPVAAVVEAEAPKAPTDVEAPAASPDPEPAKADPVPEADVCERPRCRHRREQHRVAAGQTHLPCAVPGCPCNAGRDANGLWYPEEAPILPIPPGGGPFDGPFDSVPDHIESEADLLSSLTEERAIEVAGGLPDVEACDVALRRERSRHHALGGSRPPVERAIRARRNLWDQAMEARRRQESAVRKEVAESDLRLHHLPDGSIDVWAHPEGRPPERLGAGDHPALASAVVRLLSRERATHARALGDLGSVLASLKALGISAKIELST